VYVGAWSVLVALYAMAIVVQNRLTVATAIGAALAATFVPSVLGWVLWRISPWLNHERRSLASRSGLHLCFAMLFAVTSVSSDYFQLRRVPSIESRFLLRTIVPWQFVSALVLYIAIAAVSWAVLGARRSRELAIAAARADQLRAQAELAALRAHINPHFLFNALHAVTQLLHTQPERASAALERLAALFRYVLRLDRERVELVTLEEEWEFAQDYLWLEALRLGDRLRVHASFDDDALLCGVPPFTLQPLIENAIKHGLAPHPAGGDLSITAREDARGLVITVEDTGVGASPTGDSETGIGLRAVRQRLAARHGDRATVTAGPRDGSGFVVHLHMPVESTS
jgi:signal transduction histidine kinase